MQLGDGTSGTNRLAPVAVSGLSTGVVLVAVAGVQVLVVCLCSCVLGMIVGARVCLAVLPGVACSWGIWMSCDVDECVGCACGV